MNDSPQVQPPPPNPPTILHVCKREMLRPLRDQILRLSGFHVESTLSAREAISIFKTRPTSLILIDVEGEHGIPEAEHLCQEIKTTDKRQLVAFVCNWRVAIITDCPDDIIRSEFDPSAFVAGVRNVIENN